VPKAAISRGAGTQPATDPARSRTGPRPTPRPTSRWRLFSPVLATLVPALVSGGLLWSCYFPLACGWLAWLALVPLLCLVRSQARGRLVFLSALLGGLVLFVPVLQWMRFADPRMIITWVLLAIYCALFVAAGIALLRFLDRRTRLPLALTVPLVWTALEFLRAHFLGGFPWYFLGHSQHNCLPLIQVADLAGVYAITFLLAAVNAVLFEWLFALGWFRRCLLLTEGRQTSWRLPAVSTAAAALLLGGTLAYGFWRLGQENFSPGPRVALLQGNIPQHIRNVSSNGDDPNQPDAATQMFKHYEALTWLAKYQEPIPDLIVWPETCYPDDWYMFAPDVPPEKEPVDWKKWTAGSDEMAHTVTRAWPTHLLLGLNTRVMGADGKVRRYNSSVLLRPDASFAGRYDKIHLVPFGEYVPLREWLPWMNALSPYDFDYSVTPGEQQTRFAVGDYHFGMVICYEDTDPSLARRYAHPAESPRVDFLVNTSNDGWFEGSSEHEQHLATARFRAVECRRPLLRAVNMGISAVIDGSGRVVAPQTVQYFQMMGLTIPVWNLRFEHGHDTELRAADWGRFKKTHGVLLAVVPLDNRQSLYAVYGDWLPWGCWLGLGAGILWWAVRRRGRAGSAKSPQEGNANGHPTEKHPGNA
jgi:apolipoprotein N-acyltransferase